jgi:hypothetical protein
MILVEGMRACHSRSSSSHPHSEGLAAFGHLGGQAMPFFLTSEDLDRGRAMGEIMVRMKSLPACPYHPGPADKLYFLHIYKTAGTTFRALLESRFDPREVCPAHRIDELLRLPASSLGRYRLFWGHLGLKLTALMPLELIHLTLLRDPVEHVLSIYHAVCREPTHVLHDRVRRAGLSLEGFLRDEDAVPFVRNQQVFTLAWWHLIQDRLPETVAIRREADVLFRSVPDDVLVELVQERLDRFAFVGVTERMADVARLLSHTFGWEPFGAVPRLNAAPQRTRKENLAPAIREAIETLTRLDARVYAHAKRLFESRFRQMLRAERHLQAVPTTRPARARARADAADEELARLCLRLERSTRTCARLEAELEQARARLVPVADLGPGCLGVARLVKRLAQAFPRSARLVKRLVRPSLNPAPAPDTRPLATTTTSSGRSTHTLVGQGAGTAAQPC